MIFRNAVILLGIAASLPVFAGDPALQRPKAGKVETMPLSQIKPGMKATAWTVFQGTEPEPVPIEIVGRYKNQWGPKQDIIIGKMGGKAIRTNVAGGMSGSPVYIDGKLIGALSLRMSTFSPDAICGITPIEYMLEINDLDTSRPEDAHTPEKVGTRRGAASAEGMLGDLVAAGAVNGAPPQISSMTPIETPVALSGFSDSTIREFGPMFQQMGIPFVQGGASSTAQSSKPVAGWEHSLNPGESVAGVLVSGDFSITGLGTVTYNDGKRVLAFGHPFFNLGPVDMPMAKSEILMVLSSAYQPNKFGNATEVVGALHQDRYSGIMGELGAESPIIPVHVKVRSLGDRNAVLKEKNLNFNVFMQQKWTPFLMMMTLVNSLQQMNEYADEMTYRMSGNVEM